MWNHKRYGSTNGRYVVEYVTVMNTWRAGQSYWIAIDKARPNSLGGHEIVGEFQTRKEAIAAIDGGGR